jgi:hypothetical protein
MRNTKAQLFAEVQRLEAELAKAQALAVHQPVARAYPPKVSLPVPQWQLARINAMAAAREAAMAIGKTVKV